MFMLNKLSESESESEYEKTALICLLNNDDPCHKCE